MVYMYKRLINDIFVVIGLLFFIMVYINFWSVCEKNMIKLVSILVIIIMYFFRYCLGG